MEITALPFTEQMRMIKGVEGITPKKIDSAGDTDGKNSFVEFLKKSVNDVNTLENQSEKAVQQSVQNEEAFPHTTFIALQKADVSFQLLLGVQRKIIEAYREVLRTPIG